MDDADRTDLNEAVLTNAEVQRIRKEANQKTYTGFCLFCGEPVKRPFRFCDADCREMWEKKQRFAGDVK